MKNIIIKILKKQEEIIIELIIDNKDENIELNNRIIIKSFVVDEIIILMIMFYMI